MTEYDGDVLRLGVLGPVMAARGEHAVPLGGRKQRAVLAVLLLRVGEVVTPGQLSEALWGDSPPPTSAKMIQVLVSKLRRTLGPDGAMIRTEHHGYSVALGNRFLDLARCEELLREARRHDGAAGEVAPLLIEAQGLWRGEPLSDVADEPFAQLAVPRLRELWFAVLEERIQADIDRGRHREVVGELRQLVAEHPLRERFAELLMLALYRSGRQVESLQVATDLRERLSEEFGLDPHPGARRLELAILGQEPGLAPPSDAGHRPPPAAPPSEGGAVAELVTGGSRRRPLVAIVGVATVALLIAGSAAYLRYHHRGDQPTLATTGSRTHHPTMVADSLAVLDARSGDLLADVPTGHDPGPVTAGANSIWVGNRDDHTISRVDPSGTKLLGTVGTTGPTNELVESGDRVWIGNSFDGTLSQENDRTGQLTAPFYPDGAQAGLLSLAVSSAGLWVARADGLLAVLDPASLRVTASTRLPSGTGALAADGTTAWVLPFSGHDLFTVDDIGRRVSTSALPGQGSGVALTYATGSLWVVMIGPDRLLRLDATTLRVQNSFKLAYDPGAVIATRHAVWIASKSSGRLQRFSSDGTAPPATFDVGHPIGGLAGYGDRLFLTLDQG